MTSDGKKSNISWEQLTEIFGALKDRSKMPKQTRSYRLTLSDTGGSDGYFVNFNTEISIFDYAELLQNYFDVQIELGYREDIDETLDGTHEMTEIKEFLEALEDEDE